MRDFLNSILSFIGASSLTDGEFDDVELETYGYNQATYEALSLVLDSRENVSTQQSRLVLFFNARGIEVSATAQAANAKTNILIGDVLE